MHTCRRLLQHLSHPWHLQVTLKDQLNVSPLFFLITVNLLLLLQETPTISTHMSLRIYKIATMFTIVWDSLLVFIYYITISLSTWLPPFFWYDGIPSGMLGGLWSLKRTVIKPPKRWLQVDSWWIVPQCLFPSTHTRAQAHTYTHTRFK